MTLIITLSKDVADEAEAKTVFEQVKQDVAVGLDMTMSGYTTNVIKYETRTESPT